MTKGVSKNLVHLIFEIGFFYELEDGLFRFNRESLVTGPTLLYNSLIKLRQLPFVLRISVAK